MNDRSPTRPVAVAEPSPKSIVYVVCTAPLFGSVVTPQTNWDVPINMSRLGIINVSAEAAIAESASRHTVSAATHAARPHRTVRMTRALIAGESPILESLRAAESRVEKCGYDVLLILDCFA